MRQKDTLHSFSCRQLPQTATVELQGLAPPVSAWLRGTVYGMWLKCGVMRLELKAVASLVGCRELSRPTKIPIYPRTVLVELPNGHSLRPPRHVSMAEIYPSIAQCAVVAAAFKILLFPA